MADKPRFSITIPAYNAEATLAETVASVQTQSFEDFEVVICNDGSTDGTLELAELLAAADSRIRVVSQENRGSGGAYNTAVRAAKSDLLVMLSADDLLLPDHLSQFDMFIDLNPDAAIFSADVFVEYEDGTRELTSMHKQWADPSTCALTDLVYACFYGIGAVYRREVFDTVGGFKEDIYAEDYVFWLLALTHGYRHRYLDKPLAVHRRNLVQKSADALKMRHADITAIEHALATGLMDEEQEAAARHSISRLRRNIRIRWALGSIVGQDRATAIINRLLGRRSLGDTHHEPRG